MARWSTGVGILLLGCCAACSDLGPAAVESGLGSLQIHAAVNSPTITTLVVEVKAPDLTDPFVFNLELVAGVADGTIVVPAGANRRITVRAYDVGGIQTHEGVATVPIRPGPNPTVRIVLRPLNGDQPIQIVLGSFAVRVTPEAPILSVGQTLQMQAAVTDVDGAVVAGTNDVVWATDAPAVASVNPAGLVTGHLTGNAAIIASYGGVAASVHISVADLAATSSAFDATRPAASAAFGPLISSLPAGELTGEVVYVGRGCPAGSLGGAAPEDPYLADPAGKIALIERGSCTFVQKVARAQLAGASAVIVHDNVAGLVRMGPDGSDRVIVIPAVSVELSTGLQLRTGTPPVTIRITVVGA